IVNPESERHRVTCQGIQRLRRSVGIPDRCLVLQNLERRRTAGWINNSGFGKSNNLTRIVEPIGLAVMPASKGQQRFKDAVHPNRTQALAVSTEAAEVFTISI